MKKTDEILKKLEESFLLVNSLSKIEDIESLNPLSEFIEELIKWIKT